MRSVRPGCKFELSHSAAVGDPSLKSSTKLLSTFHSAVVLIVGLRTLVLPRQDTWLSCHLPRHGQEWGRHGPLGCFSTSAPCSRLGSRVLVSCPCGFQLTCQDGVQLCHHVLCVVQAEAHRWLKFQDVPSRTISAQQNVVLLQPVGQDTAGPAASLLRALQGCPQPGLGLRASALATLPLEPSQAGSH